MRPKTFYRNTRLRYIYICVDRIIKTTPKEQLIYVSWWRQDEKTGKLVNMNTDGELWVKSEDNEWVPMDESTIERVFQSWRV